ncbi:MAG: S9 family peptidase [Myxococcales bacterium]|nr:S9 family peptidase [Myxococcales bacterium]
MRLRAVMPALWLCACAGAPSVTPGVSPASVTPPSAAIAPGPDAAAAPADPMLALRARVRTTRVETLHGVEVSDPYRALETDSPDTRAWVDAQNAQSQAFLDARPRPAMARRIGALLSIGALRAPAVGGGAVFFLSREGTEETAVLKVARRRNGRREAPAVLVDPARFGARSAIDWYDPSPSGRYVAFGVSQNGDERSTLRVIEVATGRLLDEAIGHTKWSHVSWMPNEQGFYYTRFPREGEDVFDAAQQDVYFARVSYHALESASDGRDDPTVFKSDRRTDRPSASVGDDGRTVLVHLFRGWSESFVYVLNHDPRAATLTPESARPVFTAPQSLSSATIHRGRVYLRTNANAPRYRLLALPVASLPRDTAALDPARWQTLIAEGEHPLEGFSLTASRIVAWRLEDIVSRVSLYDLQGRPQGALALPGDGSLGGVDTDARGETVALLYSSLVTPPTVLTVEGRGPARAGQALRPEPLAAAQSDVDFSQLELERGRVRSADGTAVNVFLLHRRGIARDGSNPVLLYGYGGFNVPLLSRFLRDPLYWVERGGVYAMANLRGGSEFGEAWHRAGALDQKEHVFEDFEAVIAWLSSSGLSRPDRIALHGASNGGLLMGAMITRVPTQFRAAVAGVGLYDMVRFPQFPPAEIWMSEYGDPSRADDFRWLYRYSPYHRVVDGTAYPTVWIETADHDTRVHWAHSTKFAARLQEATSSANPVHFFMQRDVGHGSGTQRSDQLRALVRMYTFVEDALAMPPVEGP